MKTKYSLGAYILIGIGVYFLLKELKLPILTDFYSWPTLLIIVGAALLFHGFTQKDKQNLFSGTIVLGLGIHFHGRAHYLFWIDHWGVYLLIVGIAFIVRGVKSKKSVFTGIMLSFISILLIFSERLPASFSWVYELTEFLDIFWPVILIGIGFYWLKKK